MRYAIYLRKSRADDTSEPLEVTLQRHRQMLEKYMQQHDIAVQDEDVFEEVVSGDSLYARPQMLRLLEAVEAGTYTGVLCVDIQRLGRGSMQDQGMILDAFKWSDTKIITPTRTYDLSNDMDETYTEFESFMGRQEYKMIKKRLRRGLNATIENGGYIANAPYGYDKTKIGKTPSLKINEAEAKFIHMIFTSTKAVWVRRPSQRRSTGSVQGRAAASISRAPRCSRYSKTTCTEGRSSGTERRACAPDSAETSSTSRSTTPLKSGLLLTGCTRRLSTTNSLKPYSGSLQGTITHLQTPASA